MSKSKKNKAKKAAAKAPAKVSAKAPAVADADEKYVNTVGIDVDYQPEDEEYDGERALTLAEKIINYATLALTMLLLGGSIVFWWIVMRYLVLNPSNLVDSKQMSAVLLCCGVVPLIITVIQGIRKKPVDIERWLVCMCLSGAISAVLVVIYQVWIRDVLFSFGDFPTLLCCTVAGSALPSLIYLGVRWLIPVVKPYFKAAEPYNRSSWEAVKNDVLALCDFDVE